MIQKIGESINLFVFVDKNPVEGLRRKIKEHTRFRL